MKSPKNNPNPRSFGAGIPDLSSLAKARSPITTTPRDPGAAARGREMFGANPYGEPVGELTPSEMNEAAILTGELMSRYSDKPMTEETVRKLENEAQARFAEELGLVVSVSWDNNEPDVSPSPTDDTVIFTPDIIIEARCDKVATDYEKIALEVQQGQADGKAGVLRPDGTFREDSKKKNVF